MKKSVFMLFTVLILCLVCAGGAWADEDLFAGQKALSQKDIDCFCSWGELEQEYSSTDMDKDTFTAKRDALFKKAGWDKLRQGYVRVKIILIVKVIISPPFDEELNQFIDQHKALLPTDKEIDLVKKNKDKIGKVLGVPF